MFLYSRGIWFWKQWIVGCNTCGTTLMTTKNYKAAREAFDSHYGVDHP